MVQKLCALIEEEISWLSIEEDHRRALNKKRKINDIALRTVNLMIIFDTPYFPALLFPPQS